MLTWNPTWKFQEAIFNVTLYYEKYGLSARARYTWRSAYRSTDFGSTDSYPWGFPVVQNARGQLNASVQYAINEHYSRSSSASSNRYRPAATACGSMVVRGKLPRASLSLETTAIDPLSG